MSFFDRAWMQLKGVSNDAMDAIEDPSRTSRQSVREMQEDLQKVTSAIIEVEAQYNQLQNKLQAAKDNVSKYTNYAVQAVQKGNDSLAKDALADKQTAETQQQSVQSQIDALSPNLNKLKAAKEMLSKQVSQAEQQADTLAARATVAKAQGHVADVLGGVGQSGAGDALARMQAKVEKQESLAQAKFDAANANIGAMNHDDKYAALGQETSSVDDELAKLKASLGK